MTDKEKQMFNEVVLNADLLHDQIERLHLLIDFKGAQEENIINIRERAFDLFIDLVSVAGGKKALYSTKSAKQAADRLTERYKDLPCQEVNTEP